MALEKALVSMAEQFSGLPMGDLIGAPLLAAAEANNAMSETQTQFLLDTCFQEENNEGNVNYSAVRIQMDITKNDDSEDKTTFDLPLVTVIPLDSLAVNDSNIKARSSNQQRFSKSENKEHLTTQIPCPECNSPIVIDMRLLISGTSFECSNYNCSVSLRLSQESLDLVQQTHNDFVNLKSN